MTDSIKTTLNLTKIAPLVRMDIDAKVSTTTNLWGEVSERYTKPSHQQSALTKTTTKWIVRCAPDPDHPDLGLVPTQIDADMHIPNSTVGHNLFTVKSPSTTATTIWLWRGLMARSTTRTSLSKMPVARDWVHFGILHEGLSRVGGKMPS